MSEPFVPKVPDAATEDDAATTDPAVEPLEADPDVLPGAPAPSEEPSELDLPEESPPFRTPTAGDSLAPDDLKD